MARGANTKMKRLSSKVTMGKTNPHRQSIVDTEKPCLVCGDPILKTTNHTISL